MTTPRFPRRTAPAYYLGRTAAQWQLAQRRRGTKASTHDRGFDRD
jgi:hypothetical protein